MAQPKKGLPLVAIILGIVFVGLLATGYDPVGSLIGQKSGMALASVVILGALAWAILRNR